LERKRERERERERERGGQVMSKGEDQLSGGGEGEAAGHGILLLAGKKIFPSGEIWKAKLRRNFGLIDG